MTRKRDITVDAIRGLAVLSMLSPNMISVLEGTAPYALRVYGSFAAPFFITLAGMMVSVTAEMSHYRYGHYLKRGVWLLLTGACVDMAIPRYIPFLTVDVLYLVGVSLPLLALFRNSRPSRVFLVFVGIMAATPFLQNALGYADYPHEFYLSGERTFLPTYPSSVLHHWIIDGWFPLFPWLGMSFFGLWLGQLRRTQASELFLSSNFRAGAALLTTAGIALWAKFPPPALVRGDYSEVFYPPQLPHLMTALGALMLALSWACRRPQFRLWTFARPLGEAPLFFYILHLAIIAYVIRPLFGHLSLLDFITLSGIFASLLIAVGFSLRRWKNAVPGIRVISPLRFLLGS